MVWLLVMVASDPRCVWEDARRTAIHSMYKQQYNSLYSSILHTRMLWHRRRIYAEEKAKVVAGVWRTDFIPFLAALAILQQDNLKNRINSSFLHIILMKFILFYISFWCLSCFSSYHPGAKKLARQEIEYILSPQTAATMFAFSYV